MDKGILHERNMEYNPTTSELCEAESCAIRDGETKLQGRCTGCQGRKRGMGFMLQGYTAVRRDIQITRLMG